MGIHSQITVKLEHPNYSICQFSQIRNTSRNPKHFSLTETLLTIPNSSRKPKHFLPPPGFEPGPHRTTVHCFIHQATGYFLSYEVKTSRFKLLICQETPTKKISLHCIGENLLTLRVFQLYLSTIPKLLLLQKTFLHQNLGEQNHFHSQKISYLMF